MSTPEPLREHPGYVLVCAGNKDFRINAPAWHLALEWARSRAREHRCAWLVYEAVRPPYRQPGDLLLIIQPDAAGKVRVKPAC